MQGTENTAAAQGGSFVDLYTQDKPKEDTNKQARINKQVREHLAPVLSRLLR